MELQHIGHEHPLVFIQHPIVASEEENEEYNCLGCGKPVEGWCYGCNECKLYMHKECAELDLDPHLNHPFHPQHLLSFSPRSPYHGPYKCRLCFNTFWGFAYYCATCEFDLHINCALLQSSMSANFPNALHPHPLFFIQNHDDQVKHDCSAYTDERSKEELSESLNLITDIVEQRSVGELMVASEIKHAYHDHNLTLTFSGEIDGDSQCDGCMRPISTPSYSCDQCKFFLHKDCAELPRTMRHPFHKHLLTLTNSDFYLKCTGCRREYHGFSYRCCKNDCSQIVHPEVNFDLQCMLFSDTLKHPSHEHSLFLVHKFDGVCSGCLTGRYLWHNNIAYREVTTSKVCVSACSELYKNVEVGRALNHMKILRDENKALKTKVEEMKGKVEE
ncbi:hypothetical protein V6N11_061048 [Hibiscus sabdariffa]|uniref:Phorbol-ester/DAG-type domain-containing protein n=1 Tax=Hibiscus sabdariffa TaxID=183260 RepID=A0ABR2QS87_9ROSI